MQQELTDFLYNFILERGIELDKSAFLTMSFKQDFSLDSFEILTLVMQIELEFGVKVSPEELLDPSTETVSGFISLITSKL
jgi:acyl carrier protein